MEKWKICRMEEKSEPEETCRSEGTRNPLTGRDMLNDGNMQTGGDLITRRFLFGGNNLRRTYHATASISAGQIPQEHSRLCSSYQRPHFSWLPTVSLYFIYVLLRCLTSPQVHRLLLITYISPTSKPRSSPVRISPIVSPQSTGFGWSLTHNLIW